MVYGEHMQKCTYNMIEFVELVDDFVRNIYELVRNKKKP